jgi:urease accessory protein
MVTQLSTPRITGILDITFAVGSTSLTQLTVVQQQPPLQIVRAFTQPDGPAVVHLHNVSGGVLGGDRFHVRIGVGVGAQAQLTTTGATRLYRSRMEHDLAEQTTLVDVSSDAVLEYVPDATIPFAGSRYQQTTKITLSEGAGLFWWETIAAGRVARGEAFAYDLLRLKLDIEAAGRLIASERMELEPGKQGLSTRARLGPYRYFTTFYICYVGLSAARWLELEACLAELAQRLSIEDSVWGVSTLPAHGLVVRALSRSGRTLHRGLLQFWQQAKRELYSVDAVPPRKLM